MHTHTLDSPHMLLNRKAQKTVSVLKKFMKMNEISHIWIWVKCLIYRTFHMFLSYCQIHYKFTFQHVCVCVCIYMYIYICVCVCVYVCVCLYICVCMYMCVYIYIYSYTCICVYTYIFIYVCVCVYIYIFIYIYVCVCVCVCIYIFIYICVCVYMYIYIYIFPYIFVSNANIKVCIPMYLYINVCMVIYICIHVYLLSGARSNGNDGILHLPQSSKSKASQLDAVFCHTQDRRGQINTYTYIYLPIYQPLHSGRIWHKDNFWAAFNRSEFRVFLLLD